MNKPLIVADASPIISAALAKKLTLLYIAQKIAKAHHGTITAKSDGQDKGSIFTLTLPVMQVV